MSRLARPASSSTLESTVRPLGGRVTPNSAHAGTAGPRWIVDRLLVGNDIIDLRDPRCAGKSRHLRFVSRVFHSAEASRILSAADADGALWLHWAAKEAAYKVVSKLLGEPPVFEHRAFVVNAGPAPAPASHPTGPTGLGAGFDASGSVSYRNVKIPYRAAIDAGRIHALAWSGEDPDGPVPDIGISTGEARVRGPGSDKPGPEDASDAFRVFLKERFTVRERRSIHSPQSAHVRLMARAAIADTLRMDERRLEVICGNAPTGRTPPRVLLDGLPGPVDVSLSHHGQRVAWAYALAPREV